VALPDFPPAFYPVAILAILVTGVSKGGFGQGAGGLAVPLMSMFIAPAEAAGIMLPILCAMDIFGVHAYRRAWSRRHVKIMLPGALVGIALGGLAFGLLPANAIRLLIGIIAITFALNQWFRFTERIARRLTAAHGHPPGPAAGAFWGAVSGFTSTLAHAGGPPFAIYMLAQKVDKTLFVGTSAVFFIVVNYAKLVPYYFLGQLNVGNLTTALVFSPLAPLGIWLGVWIHRRMTQTAFLNVSYALLLATGAKLIYDAATH
jgi:uncharacterized membrane protein YfcA